MGYTVSRPTKKEQSYLLLGLILGALLSFLGSIVANAHFRIFNMTEDMLMVTYIIALIGFIVIIIGLFRKVWRTLK